MRVRFISPLIVKEHAFSHWQIQNPFLVDIDEGGITYRVSVKASFVTDFCTVPRLPFAYLLYGGIANKAGVLHDWLYKAESMWKDHGRAWADKAFRAALEECGVGFFRRNMMYAAVRAFGWRYWIAS